jgi:hypothetical protein
MKKAREEKEWKNKFFTRGIELSGAYSPSRRNNMSQLSEKRAPQTTVSTKGKPPMAFASSQKKRSSRKPFGYNPSSYYKNQMGSGQKGGSMLPA